MQKILDNILTILSPHPKTDYSFFEANAEKPEVLLMVKCK